MQDLLFPSTPFQYLPVNPATWVYLSSLLMIGLFFKFGRLWSLRNLDLIALIALAPGLLVAQYVSPEPAPHPTADDLAIQFRGYIWLFAVGGVLLLRLLIDPMLVRRPLLEPNLSLGGMTFLGLSLFLFLTANVLTKRPEPASVAAAEAAPRTGTESKSGTVDSNSPDATEGKAAKNKPDDADSTAGNADPVDAKTNTTDSKLDSDKSKTNAPDSNPKDSKSKPAEETQASSKSAKVVPPATDTASEPPTAQDGLHRYGPGLDLFTRLAGNVGSKSLTLRIMAILCHLAVVIGIVVIGYRHFDNYRTGVSVATLYLMLPYTAQKTGEIVHVLPAAFLTWVLVFYRRPLTAGLLMGVAIGFYYPLFLLPVWISFYWRRGLFRFLTGVGVSVLVLVAWLALDAWQAEALADFPNRLRQMFGLTLPTMEYLRGFWNKQFVAPHYRLPVLAAFVGISVTFAIWPAQKNLGTLLSCTAAVMLGIQFWHGFEGGLYVGWYLPVLLLTIFRPNLEDRVALAVLPEGRSTRWRWWGEGRVKAA
jgi:hypothetical protein